MLAGPYQGSKSAGELRMEGYVVECPECGGEMHPYGDPWTGDDYDIKWCCHNVNCGNEIDNKDIGAYEPYEPSPEDDEE